MSLPIQPQLRPVVVLSPCGALLDETALNQGVAFLQAAGHEVRVPCEVYARWQRFAGGDAVRLAALQQALMATTSDAALIMASRGGYGASRLLHTANWPAMAQALQRNGRVLCGHSDVTAIQLALLAAGAPLHSLLHGPMVCFDFGQTTGVDTITLAYFNDATRAGCIKVAWPSSWGGGHDFNVKGPVWGGNLSLVCQVLGTPFWPCISGGILILEDVNEPVYKLERMLLQLLHAGVLQQQKAVVLGQFNPPAPVAHDNGYTFEAMVEYLQTQLPCPLLTQFPFGHCTPKACWYQGMEGALVFKQELGQAVLTQP